METTAHILKMPTIGVWSEGLVGIEVKRIDDDLITVVWHNCEVIVTEIQWESLEDEDADWYIEVHGNRYYGRDCMKV